MLHAYIDFYWLYSAPATLFVSLSCRVQTSVPCPMGHRVTRISTAHICGAMPEVIRKEDEVKVMEPAFEKLGLAYGFLRSAFQGDEDRFVQSGPKKLRVRSLSP